MFWKGGYFDTGCESGQSIFVEVGQPDGTCVRKNRCDSNAMFPADWNRERIIEKIDSARKNQKLHEPGNKWRGVSKSGVVIEGYKNLSPTAYPIYKKEN